MLMKQNLVLCSGHLLIQMYRSDRPKIFVNIRKNLLQRTLSCCLPSLRFREWDYCINEQLLTMILIVATHNVVQNTSNQHAFWITVNQIASNNCGPQLAWTYLLLKALKCRFSLRRLCHSPTIPSLNLLQLPLHRLWCLLVSLTILELCNAITSYLEQLTN